jgi:hypothetical protein
MGSSNNRARFDIYLDKEKDSDLIGAYDKVGNNGYAQQLFIAMAEKARRKGINYSLILSRGVNPENIDKKDFRKIRLNVDVVIFNELFMLWRGLKKGTKSNVFLSLIRTSYHDLLNGDLLDTELLTDKKTEIIITAPYNSVFDSELDGIDVGNKNANIHTEHKERFNKVDAEDIISLIDNFDNGDWG